MTAFDVAGVQLPRLYVCGGFAPPLPALESSGIVSSDGRQGCARLHVIQGLEHVPPTTADFERALRSLLDSARAAGRETVNIRAGDLHKQVCAELGGGNAMPSCCGAMRKLKRDDDFVIKSPPKGNGSNFEVRYHLNGVPTQPSTPLPAPLAIAPAAQDQNAAISTNSWYWEGNVQEAMVHFLEATGWSISATADTASLQHGIDIVACKDGATLAVEVKGYPSTTYARGSKKGQKKPTSPTLQAQHWLAEVLIKTLRTPHKYPEHKLAICLPDFPRYRTLLGEIRWALERLNVSVFLVDAHGQVTQQL